ncbi:MAG: hypothetical protein E3J96_02810 [Sulfurovum sp.]|nr:MAG: hypothetical protein E3J96_02810 [Sulfurovum sp.]
MSQSQNTVEVHQIFNRDKLLDEAVFLGICGLNMCKDKEFITGVVRLEMARDKLDKVIKHIYKEKLKTEVF